MDLGDRAADFQVLVRDRCLGRRARGGRGGVFQRLPEIAGRLQELVR